MVQSKTALFEKDLVEMAVLFKALAHPARLRHFAVSGRNANLYYRRYLR